MTSKVDARFLEFVASTNHAFMFHKCTDAGDNIVAYDVFHADMVHVAIVQFYQENDKNMCRLVTPKGKLITDMSSDQLIRECDGELVSIWQCGFNMLAEKLRLKLKLKSA